MREALGHADAFLRRSKLPINAEKLTLLWLASELQWTGGAPPHGVNLVERLRAEQTQLAKGEEPRFNSYARLLEIYLALVSSSKR